MFRLVSNLCRNIWQICTGNTFGRSYNQWLLTISFWPSLTDSPMKSWRGYDIICNMIMKTNIADNASNDWSFVTISQINRRKCDKNYSLFRIASLHVACGRDQFYIRVSIVPIFGNGATLGKRSNWYFLELCCAKLGSLTWWCLVVARRLLALQLLLMFS